MLRLVTCILFVLSCPSAVFATPQRPDILIYQDKSYELFSTPLNSYYKDERARPAFRIDPNYEVVSNNWRGYIATWEIKDDLLYLVKIESWICTYEEMLAKQCKKAGLKELFGEKYVDGRVLADWFSGELNVPEGKRIDDFDMSYYPKREKETIFTVEKGKIIKSTKVDNAARKGL